MASRVFLERDWAGEDGFVADFAAKVAGGWRVESMSLAGLAPNPSVACIWRNDLGDAPLQELSGLHDARGFLEEVTSRTEERWGPAVIAGTKRNGSNRFAVVWERLREGVEALAAPYRMLNDFGEFAGALLDGKVTPKGLYPRSIDVIPSTDGSSPTYIATVWPYPGTRFGWGVSQLPATALTRGAVAQSPEAVARSAVSYPWQVVPLPHYGSQLVVASWRDVFFDRWTKDAFDRSAHRERDFLCDPFVGEADFPMRRAEREGDGHELLHVATNAIGGDKTYSALWIRLGAEPLPRRFFRNGIGNGRNAVQAPDRVPTDGPEGGLYPPPAADDARGARPELQGSLLGGNSGFEVPAGGRVEDRRDRGELGDGGVSEGGFRPGGGSGAPRGGFGGGQSSGGGVEAGGGFGTSSDSFGTDDRGFEQGSRRTERLHPIDALMEHISETYGPRAGQVAVIRKDKLAFLRSYTYAEQGYRTTNHSHRMRLGSVPKAITATGLATHYMRLVPGDPQAGLSTRLAEALQMQRPYQEPAFDAVTIREAMQHKTGIVEDDMGGLANVYLNAHGAPAPGHTLQAALQAGDMREALKTWPTPLVTAAPGVYRYNNLVYVALTELLGSLGTGGDFTKYVEAVEGQLPMALRNRPEGILTGASYADCVARREVPYHDLRIGVGPSPWHEGRWDTGSYTGCPQFGTGAGWWALSALEMAMVLRQLSDGSNELWPTVDEKALMRLEELGWIREYGGINFQEASPGSKSDTQRTMWHNGELGGASAVAIHCFRAPSETLSLVAMFNGGALATELGPELLHLFLEAAQETEDTGGWAEQDLFGLVSLDPIP